MEQASSKRAHHLTGRGNTAEAFTAIELALKATPKVRQSQLVKGLPSYILQ